MHNLYPHVSKFTKAMLAIRPNYIDISVQYLGGVGIVYCWKYSQQSKNMSFTRECKHVNLYKTFSDKY